MDDLNNTIDSSFRKKFSGEEILDTSTMRIMDMISYNPKNGQMLPKKVNNKDKSVESEGKESQHTPAKLSAPQVKIGLDGNIILDESSLKVVREDGESSRWEVIDGDRANHKTTSLSFRNRLWRKGTPWTEKETELFYEILRCTGPDFGLMHQYFPTRARRELKAKYNREEKNNWSKLKNVMSKPMVLDDSLNIRVERLQKDIEEEAENLKEKRKKRKPSPEDVSLIDWDENTADLVAEAEQIIKELEEESKLNEEEIPQEKVLSKTAASIIKKVQFKKNHRPQEVRITRASFKSGPGFGDLVKYENAFLTKLENTREELSNDVAILEKNIMDKIKSQKMVKKIDKRLKMFKESALGHLEAIEALVVNLDDISAEQARLNDEKRQALVNIVKMLQNRNDEDVRKLAEFNKKIRNEISG